ncbi:MAG: sulfotransferase domain-containing protein [Pseudomonadota bacterium]
MNTLRYDRYMAWLAFNRQLFNPTVIKHNRFDAHIATAKNSGTHWIKYTLSHVLVQMYDLPEPEHIMDDSIIGHPKSKPVYDHIPQVVITHSHPHYVMRVPAAYKTLNIPRCISVARNPVDLLVSLYEKHKGEYIDKRYGHEGVSFSEYLRSDVKRTHNVETIWGIIRFFNAWGAVAKAAPDYVMPLRYEDLKADPEQNFKAIAKQVGIEDMSDEILDTALQRSSKKEMKKRLDPSETQYERTVNIEDRQSRDWYSDEDWDYLKQICARYLHHDFGYHFD